MNEALKQTRREADWQKFRRRQERRKAFRTWLRATAKRFYSELRNPDEDSRWGWEESAWIAAGVLVYYILRAFGTSELIASSVVAVVLAYELVVKREIVRPLREVLALLRAKDAAGAQSVAPGQR